MFVLEQYLKDGWYTIGCFDDLAEARAELDTLRHDPYYRKYDYRLMCYEPSN